jgi:hypothetical protein
MTKEKEKNQSDNKNVKCSWCGMVDERKIIFRPVNPRADMENLGAFHEECDKADKIFYALLFLDTDTSREQMIKIANKLAGVDINKRKIINFFHRFKPSHKI